MSSQVLWAAKKPLTKPVVEDDDCFSRLEKMLEGMALVVFVGPMPAQQPVELRKEVPRPRSSSGSVSSWSTSRHDRHLSGQNKYFAQDFHIEQGEAINDNYL